VLSLLTGRAVLTAPHLFAGSDTRLFVYLSITPLSNCSISVPLAFLLTHVAFVYVAFSYLSKLGRSKWHRVPSAERNLEQTVDWRIGRVFADKLFRWLVAGYACL
jgi:hypothetical protein